MTKQEAEDYVNKNVTEALANNIDIASFLNAEDRKNSQARKNLEKALSDYYQVFMTLPEESVNWATDEIEEYRKWVVKSAISILESGGTSAVKLMKEIMTAQGK